jgi:hypothetical protein
MPTFKELLGYKYYDYYGDDEPASKPKKKKKQKANYTWNDFFNPAREDNRPINDRVGESLAAIMASKPVQATLDILSRPSNALAAGIESFGDERSFLQGLKEGIIGKDQGGWQDVAHKYMPGPKWLKSTVGFLGDVVLDPLNLVSFGGGGLVKVGGKTVIKGEKALKAIDKIADSAKMTGIGQDVMRKFSTKATTKEGRIYKELEERVMNKASAQKAARLDLAEKEARELADLVKKTGLSKEEITNLAERPVIKLADPDTGDLLAVRDRIAELSPEQRNHIEPFLKRWWARNEENLRLEKAAGVGTKELDDELNYISHIVTDKARNKEALKELLFPKKTLDVGFKKHRKFRGMDISEINTKKGYEFFHTDPNIIQTARDIASIDARSTAELIDSIIKDGTLALISEQAPGDWVEISGKRFAGKVKGYKFHPEIAQHLTEVIKKTDPDEIKGFMHLFDSATKYWKAQTLPIFPAYHLRNMVGNLWNNWLAGVNDPSVYGKAAAIQKGANGAIKIKGGQELSFDTIRQLYRETGLERTFFKADVAQELASRAGKVGGSLNPLSADSVYVRAGRKVGSAVEDNARMALFIDRLKKGDAAEQAARTVKKYLFDYEDLTPFEKTTMRRIFPFYTYTRKNLPLQLEMLIKNPSRFNVSRDIQVAITHDEDQPNPEVTPKWMREAQAVSLGKDNEGNHRMWLLNSWLPAGDLFDVMTPTGARDKIAGMVNPFIKEPIQQAFNADWRTGNKIDYGTNKKKFFGAEVNARIPHAVQSLSRPISEASNLFDNETSAKDKVLALLGVKTYALDERKETMKVINNRIKELSKEYEAALSVGDINRANELERAIFALADQLIEVATR